MIPPRARSSTAFLLASTGTFGPLSTEQQDQAERKSEERSQLVPETKQGMAHKPQRHMLPPKPPVAVIAESRSTLQQPRKAEDGSDKAPKQRAKSGTDLPTGEQSSLLSSTLTGQRFPRGRSGSGFYGTPIPGGFLEHLQQMQSSPGSMRTAPPMPLFQNTLDNMQDSHRAHTPNTLNHMESFQTDLGAQLCHFAQTENQQNQPPNLSQGQEFRTGDLL
ncbi:hypothetical protein IE53DRAFT_365095 [Violaceomyces palustris]|uniref:Uncharacterized protein n=1 Tax=Violaceomyces palustris TaxID=1673888 RepID=A0ACD0NM48_9BASI|nr:hypothetical protein IE53DRAFT_365095 [Violaceomyces palustris]